MIEVRSLVKTYTIGGQVVSAVDKVDFSMPKGEIISIVGHSGSGKTTLLSLIGGLTKPDSGTIIIDGIDIWDMDDDSLSEFRNKRISFIYQFSSLVPTLTALENIILPATFGNFGSHIETYAKELLTAVGLDNKAFSYPSQLSGGQQRRIAIARAFITGADIVLADEPTGDLDEETEAEMTNMFKKMQQEKGTTFLIATHSSELANKADRQYKMQNGRLVT